MTIIVGKIHADWCGHCKNLIPSWKEIENKVKNKNIKVVDFEASRQLNELIEFQNKYPVAVQQGYPTLFRIVDSENTQPNIRYYTGNRDTRALINWALHGDDVKHENVKPVQKRLIKSEKTKKRKLKKNVTRNNYRKNK